MAAGAAFVLALGSSSLALRTPLTPSQPTASSRPGDGPVRSSTRRELLFASSIAMVAALPSPAHASYALYQSSYDSFQERKTTGYVPVATDDKETLAEIQRDIRRKRPQTALKPEKAPQYCAGQTSAVTPMMENICANIGVSKADQSNSMVDECACNTS